MVLRHLPKVGTNMLTKINSTIDNFLNGITMYRLVLFILLIFLGIAIALGGIGLIPFSPFAILFSTLFVTAVCIFTNEIFSFVYHAPLNVESAYITGLILALIISPASTMNDYIFLFWAGVLAMSSKYILAIKNKHLFNPAAIAVVVTAIGLGQSASWWIGNTWLALPVALCGYLITRKIRRENMIWNFLLTVFTFSIGFGILKGTAITSTISTLLLHTSLLFFAGVMLTEPLTSPTTEKWQSIFAVFTGILFLPQIHIGNIYSTPELALVIGNLFAYLVSSKEKLILHLQEKIKISPDSYDFIFPLSQPLKYKPGQYMEWTLAHPKSDSRGNRRYFTLASSPTEDNLRIGIKFYTPASSYKRAMFLNEKDSYVASQLAGDFVLPSNPNQKCAMLAGGIGVTPFRSMLKYLVDTKQKRDIVLLFANKNPTEIIYKDVFDQAQSELGIKTVYTITDTNSVTRGWTGNIGRIDEQMIMTEIPDYKDRIFYLSGPRAMVEANEETLKKLGLNKKQIKTDFFPGFA